MRCPSSVTTTLSCLRKENLQAAMSKRNISSFFQTSTSPSKKQKVESAEDDSDPPSNYPCYPQSIKCFPKSMHTALDEEMYDGRILNDKLDLDMVHYQPFLSKDLAKNIYLFLRKELPFYRVQYKIKRGTFETQINTPRFTTVFGLDVHSKFGDKGEVLDAKTGKPEPKRYTWQPRPIPQCLEVLKNKVERETGFEYNFVLVNYYANTADSISYHSDDERFLGPNPCIASLSLGTTRDFLMKHKNDASVNIKLPLASGEMVVMKGSTQKMWLHSIPKRVVKMDGSWHDGGRINVTFTKAMEKEGTGNYYNYNVGSGPVFRWHEGRREMLLREDLSKATLNGNVGMQLIKDEQDETVVKGGIANDGITEETKTTDGLSKTDIKLGLEKGEV